MASIIELAGRRNRWKFSSLGARLVAWNCRDGETWRKVCRGSGTKKASEDAHRAAVMFPWVNRIGGDSWSLEGKKVPLDLSGPLTHLHGLTADAPWEVATQMDSRVSFRFEMPAQKFYPRRADAEVGYEIVSVPRTGAGRNPERPDEALEVSITASNPNEGEGEIIYVTTGIHPYFLNPYGGGVDEMTLYCNGVKEFELDERLIPGRLIDPVPAHDFRTPQVIGDRALDNGFVLDPRPAADGGGESGTAAAPCASLAVRDFTLRITPVENCGYAQIYIPPHREEIAIEPQSGGPDAFRVHDYGLWKLAPGESRTFRVRMSARFG